VVLHVHDLRVLSLFHGLTDDQLVELVGVGAEVRIQPGVELFHEGEPADWWWVLVDGAVDLLRHVGQEHLVVGRMDVPGQWAGGFRAWDGQGVYLGTAVGLQPGRLLRVPASLLRQLTDTWFPFGGHLIAGLFTTARSIEATARQRESLVTLGKLAAGLAHELNNPAAAATRAVDALESACQVLQVSLARLGAGQITAEKLTELDTLRQHAVPPAVPLSPLALADLEEDLASWLDAQGVGRSWLLAPSLAAAGVDRAWCERALNVLGQRALDPGLEWVASSISVAGLLSEVKESTRRVFDLVAAMKSYSQMDRASLQRIDLREGLENTLVMLGHKIPNGVTVLRNYSEGVPLVEAYAGELNQVWMILIDNALDAMDGTGTLTVTTGTDGQDVVVEIGDNGPGMPLAVAARAFEPFFTTKGVGKGAGLGLDVARRIVEERHGGSIRIDSHPGDTNVRVRLPNRPLPRTQASAAHRVELRQTQGWR
jgi:signal transduction histidine kinase